MAGSIPTNSLSLQDWAKFRNDPMITKITKSLYTLSNVLTDMSFVQKEYINIRGSRWAGNLPTVNGIGFNVVPAYITGTPEQYEEQVGLIRDSAAVDTLLLRDKGNITDPVKSRIESYLEAFTYKTNDTLINATPSTEQYLSPGLKWRLDNPSLSGVFSANGTTTELKIDVAADLRAATLGGSGGQAEAYKFLEAFRRVLTRMKAPTGKNVVAYMNEELYVRFPTIIAAAGETLSFSITKDNYDRDVATYRSCRLQPIGRKADQTTQIITITENSDGTDTGASEYTSIYFAYMAEGHFSGWHFDPPHFKDIGIDDSGVIKQWTFEYCYGLMMEDNRSIARMYDLRFGSQP